MQTRSKTEEQRKNLGVEIKTHVGTDHPYTYEVLNNNEIKSLKEIRFKIYRKDIKNAQKNKEMEIHIEKAIVEVNLNLTNGRLRGKTETCSSVGG
jgi:hypothetical protein